MTAADRRRVAGTMIIGDATTVGGMRGTTEVEVEEVEAAGMTIGGGMTAAARRRVGVTRIGEAAMIGIVEEGMGRPVGTEEEGVVGSRRGTARPSGARGLRSGMRQRRLVVVVEAVEVAVVVEAVTLRHLEIHPLMTTTDSINYWGLDVPASPT